MLFPGKIARRSIPATGLRPRALARFEALQRVIVPLADNLDESGRRGSRAVVGRVLVDQPASVRRRLEWLLAAVHLYALLRHGKRFHRLPRATRQRVVVRLSRARPAALRQGMDGLATLAKLGVYGQTSLHPTFGYHPRDLPHD